ncbi:MAG TPA: fasciclin domain-containing protein [Sphingomicrobium sp.]|nr:fasciclin domain-containing protein [Sphingomicrobium sp.]
MLKTLPLCVCAAALALSACGKSTSSNNTAPEQSSAAKEAAGDKTIAASLDQNGKFFAAAKAVGLDATLAGPGPYTVLVPSDDAFGKAEGDALKSPTDPKNRAEITRILTYHILPGVILSDDISKAIENGKGKAVLATMGGETLTATKDGGNIVLTGGDGSKANVTQADIKATNGVIHDIDAVLTPPAAAAGTGQPQQGK